MAFPEDGEKMNIYSLIKMARKSFLLIAITTGFTTAAIPQESFEDQDTYDEETIIDAASGFLGEGAEAVAKALESVFESKGRPNAYITGSEAGAGLIIGIRYGGGMLHHKIEGDRKVHWTGPSVGLDAGADAVKVFGLVYNLYDTEDIYKRIAAVEGSFYYVGGMGLSYYGNEELSIAFVRVGVGLRAQATVGYINITKKKRLLPL